MNYSFLKFWWQDGKFLVMFMLLAIVASIFFYGEYLWWFGGVLLIFLNVVYFIGSYFAWKKRFKQ
jgi:hypothetical protein